MDCRLAAETLLLLSGQGACTTSWTADWLPRHCSFCQDKGPALHHGLPTGCRHTAPSVRTRGLHYIMDCRLAADTRLLLSGQGACTTSWTADWLPRHCSFCQDKGPALHHGLPTGCRDTAPSVRTRGLHYIMDCRLAAETLLLLSGQGACTTSWTADRRSLRTRGLHYIMGCRQTAHSLRTRGLHYIMGCRQTAHSLRTRGLHYIMGCRQTAHSLRTRGLHYIMGCRQTVHSLRTRGLHYIMDCRQAADTRLVLSGQGACTTSDDSFSRDGGHTRLHGLPTHGSFSRDKRPALLHGLPTHGSFSRDKRPALHA